MKKALLILPLILCGCGESSEESSTTHAEQQTAPISLVGAYQQAPASDETAESDSIKVVVLPTAEFFLVESTRSSTPSGHLPTRLNVYHGILSSTQTFSSSFIRYFEMDDGEEGISSLTPISESGDGNSAQIRLHTGILVPGSYAGPPSEDGSIIGRRISRIIFSEHSIVRDPAAALAPSPTSMTGTYAGVLRSSQGYADVSLIIGSGGNIELSGLEDGCAATGITSPAEGAFPLELTFSGSGCLLFPAQTMRGILLEDNGYLMITAFDEAGRNPVFFGSNLL